MFATGHRNEDDDSDEYDYEEFNCYYERSHKKEIFPFYSRLDLTPSLFPKELRFAVAPFWAPIDIDVNNAQVFYEVHTNTTANRAVSDFISRETQTVFVGRWALLVEWREVALSASLAATSQAVST